MFNLISLFQFSTVILKAAAWRQTILPISSQVFGNCAAGRSVLSNRCYTLAGTKFLWAEGYLESGCCIESLGIFNIFSIHLLVTSFWYIRDCVRHLWTLYLPNFSVYSLSLESVFTARIFRELHAMSVQLRRTYGKNQVNKKMLQEAFSLLAYADPWNSPVGAQLDPARRETICSALNSAILGKQISIYILKLLLVSASVLVWSHLRTRICPWVRGSVGLWVSLTQSSSETCVWKLIRDTKK